MGDPSLERRLKARKIVQEFFDNIRNKIKIDSLFPKDAKDAHLRAFLAEMNAIARDLERKAMEAADSGKDFEIYRQKAEEEFLKLKKKWLKQLGKGDPFMEALNKDVIEVIEKL